MPVEHTRLGNGVQVISEAMPSVETVSLGVWVKNGSRSEEEGEGGLFHFIEHTLFKGTPSRKARQIAESMDQLGCVLDAYTAKEETCYSIRVRQRHWQKAFSILADMIQNPSFPSVELDRERQVILEEIKLDQDNPEEVVYEEMVSRFWAGHSLCRPILGTVANVSGFQREQVAGFHKKFYHSRNFVVAAAGKIDHRQLCDQVGALFDDGPKSVSQLQVAEKPSPRAFQSYLKRNHLEQTHFCLSFPGVSLGDSRRFEVLLLNVLLGGGMSSRLFQKVREERGLAYSIGSFLTSHSDCGQWVLYGACSPQHFNQVVSLSLEEVRRFCRKPPSPEELRRGKEQVIGSFLMGLESTMTRAGVLAQDHIFENRVFDVGDYLRGVEAVSTERLLPVAQSLFRDDALGLCAVGKFNQDGPDQPWTLW